MFTHNNTAGSLLVRCKPVATPNDLVAAAGSRQCPPLLTSARIIRKFSGALGVSWSKTGAPEPLLRLAFI